MDISQTGFFMQSIKFNRANSLLTKKRIQISCVTKVTTLQFRIRSGRTFRIFLTELKFPTSVDCHLKKFKNNLFNSKYAVCVLSLAENSWIGSEKKSTLFWWNKYISKKVNEEYLWTIIRFSQSKIDCQSYYRAWNHHSTWMSTFI